MARIGFKNRIRRLEEKRNKRRLTVRLLEYACDVTGAPVDPGIGAWLSGATKSPPAAVLARYRGFLGRRLLVIPDFGTAEAWEAASRRQQMELLAVARSRTNKPTETQADSVGNSYADDVPAPMTDKKRRRFIELLDGRTLDTETRQFLDKDGKLIAEK